MSRPRLMKKNNGQVKNLASIDVEIEKLNELEKVILSVQNLKEDLDNITRLMTEIKSGVHTSAYVSVQVNSKSYPCTFLLSRTTSADSVILIITQMLANLEATLVELNLKAKAIAASLNLELVPLPSPEEFDT